MKTGKKTQPSQFEFIARGSHNSFRLSDRVTSPYTMIESRNIKFKQLSYKVENGILNKTQKNVLKDISGEFKACELTAVMGPSGCGKSSLLNILSGYITANVGGALEVKDRRKKSYIMQEENLNTLLTVSESMMFSINLKTGSQLTSGEKKLKVEMVLRNLGLEDRMETFVEGLSGGQQKRLAIALELVDDPSILFLDEPTTGLDSSSSTQCIQLLKKLAQQGKTIVCTIHTPSAILFKLFDHLYALADGRCIYQGSSENLIPFLSEVDLKCPASFNPSDFLMEIASGDYGDQNVRLTAKIKNGVNEDYRKEHENIIEEMSLEESSSKNISPVSSTCFFNQLKNLLARNFLMLYRDKSVMWLRLTIHIAVSILVGLVFQSSGNEASKIFSTFKLIYAMTIFLMYTGFYSMITKFSLDISIIKREHFNRWYSTSAYYLALTLTDIPLIVACSCIFVTTLYIMSDQPAESFRFASFLAIQILTSFVAQGFGLMIGSLFKLMGSLLFAAIILPVMVLFGGIVITRKDANIWFHWIFDLSFVKHAGDASFQTIFGYNRSRLICEDTLYCHFQRPDKLLEEIGVEDQVAFETIAALIGFLIVFRLVAFYMINYRLTH